ncbi:hypothetical protein AVEN_196323-1 [Araneus ventricosus]|uniref:Secreted protein n=1 Tax=Araneus ventricosus TaxID=182803 RepID=A0A4Y2ATV4_ARAVE|nr:hypothetical protein AVEN_196323-1 [Araneus ventricosus]
MLVGQLSPLVLYVLTPFLGRSGQCGYSCTTQTGGRLATRYDLACSGPHSRRIFGGIGSRTWNHPAEILPLGHLGLDIVPKTRQVIVR